MARTRFTLKDKEIIAKVQGQVMYETSILGWPSDVVKGYKCNGGCGFIFPLSHLEVDHLVPVAKGGSDRPSNLQLLCSVCNRRKAGKMPKRTRKTATQKARKQKPVERNPFSLW